MRVLTVVGARPQFIKAEPLGRALVGAGHEHILVHTGQHWDFGMSQVFFDELDIAPPTINLGVGSGPHGKQTAEMLLGLEQQMIEWRPDWVLVLGDTNSTLAGALAAAKIHVPLAHVEAGLRSFNRRMPEEINRVLTDHAADRLFAPTDTAVRNLLREGVDSARIVCVGDVMYDAFLHFLPTARRSSTVADTLGVRGVPYVLATIHRAENTDDGERLTTIMRALQVVAQRYPVLVPLHPRTRAALQASELALDALTPVRFIEPLGYLDMLALESEAALIVSDSGGVQKEAFFCRVPCVTLRDETEWTELVESGWNRLCSPVSVAAVTAGVLSSLGVQGADVELYGGGQSASLIAHSLSA